MSFKGKIVKVVFSEEAIEEYNELDKIVSDELRKGITSSEHHSYY